MFYPALAVVTRSFIAMEARIVILVLKEQGVICVFSRVILN